MTLSLTKDQDKRTIALNYVTISGRKIVEARGDYEAAISAVKTLRYYLDLARQYGCTDRELMFALGYSEQQFQAVA